MMNHIFQEGIFFGILKRKKGIKTVMKTQISEMEPVPSF